MHTTGSWSGSFHTSSLYASYFKSVLYFTFLSPCIRFLAHAQITHISTVDLFLVTWFFSSFSSLLESTSKSSLSSISEKGMCSVFNTFHFFTLINDRDGSKFLSKSSHVSQVLSHDLTWLCWAVAWLDYALKLLWLDLDLNWYSLWLNLAQKTGLTWGKSCYCHCHNLLCMACIVQNQVIIHVALLYLIKNITGRNYLHL